MAELREGAMDWAMFGLIGLLAHHSSDFLALKLIQSRNMVDR